ncbi:hypothetical protein Q7P35_009360 [Cladosporium inversicolor]
MSGHTNAWGDSADPGHARLHQGPARQPMVVTHSSDNYPGSMVLLDGASNVPRRSNVRPSTAAARSASDRDIRRRRGQTGGTRGPDSSTELDRHYPAIHLTNLQNDLSRAAVPQHGALLTVMHVTANDIADSHEAVPEVPVSPPISQEIPRLKLPDRGFRASLRKLSSSERSCIKSRLPKRKPYGRIDENLLFVNKYPDPRSMDFRREFEESSPSEESSTSEEDENVESPANESPASESSPPPSPTDGQDAFSVCRRAHEASITNLHGWYPGKRFYGEAEVRTE